LVYFNLQAPAAVIVMMHFLHLLERDLMRSEMVLEKQNEQFIGRQQRLSVVFEYSVRILLTFYAL
jgi:hypothetical protein